MRSLFFLFSFFLCSFLSGALAIQSTSSAYAAEDSEATQEFDPRIPRYQQERPIWAIQVEGNIRSLKETSIASHTHVIQASGEWQPAVAQRYGIPSLGIHALGTYNLSAPAYEKTFPAFGGGAQVRYQFRYFREQPLVPVVGYQASILRLMSSTPYKDSQLTIKGPVLGAWILLNYFDEPAAAEFYVDTDIKRTYLTIDYELVKGSGTGVTYQTKTFFFGLRFEL